MNITEIIGKNRYQTLTLKQNKLNPEQEEFFTELNEHLNKFGIYMDIVKEENSQTNNPELSLRIVYNTETVYKKSNRKAGRKRSHINPEYVEMTYLQLYEEIKKTSKKAVALKLGIHPHTLAKRIKQHEEAVAAGLEKDEDSIATLNEKHPY